MFRYLSILFVVMLVLSLTMQSQAEQKTATDWLGVALEQGVEALQKRDIDSDIDALYEFPELAYRVVTCDAKLGNEDRGKETLKLLALCSAWIIESELEFNDEPDLWPRTYLPGPALAVKQELTVEVPKDALNQAYATQLIAETYFALGNQAQYQQACDKTFELLKEAEEIDKQFAKDGEYPYTGGVLSWHLLRMCRDNADLKNAAKFANYPWHDPCEKSGVLAIQAQMEWAAGNHDAAMQLTVKATELMKQAVQRSRKERNALQGEVPLEELSFEIYYPELNNHLPELYAAIYLTIGAESAEQLAGLLAFEDTLWQSSGYVHAATMLRRAGKNDEAFTMVKKSMDALFAVDELPSTYDTMHLSRELAFQGKDELVQQMYNKYDNPMIKSFVAIGVVQAMLQK